MITSSAILDDWPGVAARIVTRLRRMGAERMNAEDLASEAITKALTKQVSFESPDHLFNWTMLVARNLYVDQRRAEGRAPDVYAIEDYDVPTHDTAVIAEHRMQLRRVLDAMSRMNADDRAAVMTDMSDATPADRKEAVRLNVRRHRARARLRAALAGVAGLFGLRRLPKAGLATTPVAFATVVLTIGLPFVQPALRDDAPRPATQAPADRSVLDVADRRLPTVRAAATRPATPAKPRAARPRALGRDTAATRPATPPRKQIARAGVPGRKAALVSYSEPNRAEEHLVCVVNSHVGELCHGKPIPLHL